MTETDAKKPIKKSRWVKKSGVPRYTKEQQKELDKFSETDLNRWHRGARVRPS